MSARGAYGDGVRVAVVGVHRDEGMKKTERMRSGVNRDRCGHQEQGIKTRDAMRRQKYLETHLSIIKW